MASVTEARSESSHSHASSARTAGNTQDLERYLLLALGVLDHRMASRDRHPVGSSARDQFIQLAYDEVRLALDGASIDQILEARA